MLLKVTRTKTDGKNLRSQEYAKFLKGTKTKRLNIYRTKNIFNQYFFMLSLKKNSYLILKKTSFKKVCC